MEISRVRFRFYGRLNDFLPYSLKRKNFSYAVKGNPAVRDTIEALGIPHTEIARIENKNKTVGLSYQIRDFDRFKIWPAAKYFLNQPKFILDVHLGKLAKYLRLFGMDAYYDNQYGDRAIIRQSIRQRRLVLTRDIGLLKHKRVKRGYWMRATDPRRQIREIFGRFKFRRKTRPFTRCMECNGHLKPVSKKNILRLIPRKTRKYFDEFYRCHDCRRIYWPGSHYTKMARFVRSFS